MAPSEDDLTALFDFPQAGKASLVHGLSRMFSPRGKAILADDLDPHDFNA